MSGTWNIVIALVFLVVGLVIGDIIFRVGGKR